MRLTKMFKEAKEKGATNETKMWESVALMDPILAIVEVEHPDDYWNMMRDQHELLWGPHYNEDFANYDTSKIHWTTKDGLTHHGAHWSKEQILDATHNMTFPQGTTDCDKFVAFNSYYADMCHSKDDGTIIADAHRYFFEDQDAPEGKIWRYMGAMHTTSKKH